MDHDKITLLKNELLNHLNDELLPFWLDRCKDTTNGGIFSHFDENGNNSGEDLKSLIAQTRTVYTMSAAHRAGYGGGTCAELASHAVDFLIDKMWDTENGGFIWTVNNKGESLIDKKIMYGLSFVIYSLSEYTLATDDARGQKYANLTFDLIQKYAVDTMYGGYYEMFEKDWTLCGPAAGGGDRKTLDVHMHLMEAFTTLYECSQQPIHKRTLQEQIEILLERILDPETKTGIPQFWRDWSVAPQIKFDIVWGWDRFSADGEKSNALDNTSYGHNCEFAWLLNHALSISGDDKKPYLQIIRKQLDHALAHGIDWEYGGVYVEGSHSGEVYDYDKEFWQQAEVMIGMLDGCLLFNDDKYFPAYEKVHRFVHDKMINHKVGEWWPLMNREGTEKIWTHMSHAWKVNYHTIRCMVECIKRLELLEARL